MVLGYRPKTFEHSRVHALILTILDTGCRITELLTAAVTDFDFDNPSTGRVAKNAACRCRSIYARSCFGGGR